MKKELERLHAKLDEDVPLWRVQGTNDIALHAHPVFLQDLMVAELLAPLLKGSLSEAGKIVRDRRIILDSYRAEAEEARTKMGIKPAKRFTAMADLIPLLQHYESIKGSGAVLKFKDLPVEATKFADDHFPDDALVGDFIQAHGLYVAAVQDLLQAVTVGGDEPAPEDKRMVMATNAYDLGRTVADQVGWGRLPLDARAAWEFDEPAFAKRVEQYVGKLGFATVQALLGHAFKHRVRGNPPDKDNTQFPGDEKFMYALVRGYRDDAHSKITANGGASVTSALGQLGTSRTYYFGVVNHHAAMVAVNEAGEAWISTYYAPERY
ncbi:MAG TPA: hypothetical protein VH372_06635 [Actinospica sp.]|nr:hypothetical protein [Actinospica sp.]